MFRSETTRAFWSFYGELPAQIQSQADKQYALFIQNPWHPSVRLKQTGPFWSVRISRSYRALALRDGDCFTWIWIGPHEEYERVIRRPQ
jgi:hypothetical protein